MVTYSKAPWEDKGSQAKDAEELKPAKVPTLGRAPVDQDWHAKGKDMTPSTHVAHKGENRSVPDSREAKHHSYKAYLTDSGAGSGASRQELQNSKISTRNVDDGNG